MHIRCHIELYPCLSVGFFARSGTNRIQGPFFSFIVLNWVVIYPNFILFTIPVGQIINNGILCVDMSHQSFQCVLSKTLKFQVAIQEIEVIKL